MLHPIFSVLINRPELVMDHVAGYAALVQEEASTVGSEVVKRAVAGCIALVMALVFVMLAGVAVMLGAMHGAFHWALVLVPGVALVVAVIALSVARKQFPAKAFGELKAQIDADVQALRTVRTQAMTGQSGRQSHGTAAQTEATQ